MTCQRFPFSAPLSCARLPPVEHDAVAPLVHQVSHRHPAPAVVTRSVGYSTSRPQGCGRRPGCCGRLAHRPRE